MKKLLFILPLLLVLVSCKKTELDDDDQNNNNNNNPSICANPGPAAYYDIKWCDKVLNIHQLNDFLGANNKFRIFQAAHIDADGKPHYLEIHMPFVDYPKQNTSYELTPLAGAVGGKAHIAATAPVGSGEEIYDVVPSSGKIHFTVVDEGEYELKFTNLIFQKRENTSAKVKISFYVDMYE
jgi:hypothetical protein